MSLLINWKRYFMEQPRPAAVFQIAPSYFGCLKVGKEEKISERDYLVQSIPSGVIEANFLHKNIKKPEFLEQFIDLALEKLKLQGNSVTVIIPEMSSRAFVFSLEGAFLTPAELVKFIEWRLDRQLAQPLSAVRYSYQTFNFGKEKKVLVVCSGVEVIKEYESIFQKKKLQPGKLTIPSLSIFNLVPEIKEEDFLVVDVDFDYLSLLAVIEGSLYLYRQKQLLPDLENRLEEILKEIENTLFFLEDKIRRRVKVLFLRSSKESQMLLKQKLRAESKVEIIEIGTESQTIAAMLGGW